MFTIILIVWSLLSVGNNPTNLANQRSGHGVQVDEVQQGTGTGH